MTMQPLLDQCRDCPRLDLASGDTLLREGERSGRIYVLIEGCVEVLRGEVEVVQIDEPGSMFGEMSALLDTPHTATVRALGPAAVHVVDDPERFLASTPEVALPLARLLAHRLRNVTDYLVDLKQQFRDRSDHLGMVDEVLESLTHEQGTGFIPASELPVGR